MDQGGGPAQHDRDHHRGNRQREHIVEQDAEARRPPPRTGCRARAAQRRAEGQRQSRENQRGTDEEREVPDGVVPGPGEQARRPRPALEYLERRTGGARPL